MDTRDRLNTEDEHQFRLLLGRLARDIQHNSAVHGFWDEGQNRNKGEMLALMHSELSEALEAIRKSTPEAPLMDKHLPHHLNLTVELADAVIRVLDFAAGFDLPIARAILDKHAFNRGRPPKHGKAF